MGLTSRLRSCGVEAKITDDDVHEVAPAAPPDKAAPEFQASTTMTVDQSGGALTDDARTIYFDLRLAEVLA